MPRAEAAHPSPGTVAAFRRELCLAAGGELQKGWARACTTRRPLRVPAGGLVLSGCQAP